MPSTTPSRTNGTMGGTTNGTSTGMPARAPRLDAEAFTRLHAMWNADRARERDTLRRRLTKVLREEARAWPRGGRARRIAREREAVLNLALPPRHPGRVEPEHGPGVYLRPHPEWEGGIVMHAIDRTGRVLARLEMPAGAERQAAAYRMLEALLGAADREVS